MKKLLILSTLVVAAMVFSLNSATAQKRSKKDKVSFSERLWYGGSVGLGLSSNQFNFGLAPMVGYKLTPGLSAGVRVPLNYDYFKVSGAGDQVATYSNLDYGLGSFTRLKFFKNLFAHAEYDYIWSKTPATTDDGFLLLDPDNTDKLLKEKLNKDEFHLGLGYSSGDKIGYEISVLYNVLEDPNSNNIPFSIRAGFNYKF